MPIIKYEVTMYKVGDMLYGNNSFNLKVLNINPDQSVNFLVSAPRSGTLFYSMSSNSDGWVRVPTDNILRNINQNQQIYIKLEYGTTQTVTKRLHWFGNHYYGPSRVVYGNPPYGQYNIPGSNGESVPSKDLSDERWRDNFNLGPEWRRIPGSYAWDTYSGDFWGWERQTNYAPYLNRYARRIRIDFAKDTRGELYSGSIQIDKIKLTQEKANLLPIKLKYYRGGKVTDLSDIKTKIIDPLPSESLFADPEILGPDGVNIKFGLNIIWFSDDNYNYTSTYTFKSDYPDIYPNATGNLADNNYHFSSLGEYIITVTGQLEKYTKTETFKFRIFDNTDPTPPRILENNPDHKDYLYDMNKDITIFDHYPTFPNFQNKIDEELHNIKAYYDFYQYTDEGYNVTLRDSKIPLTSDSKLSEDGQYYLNVTTTYSRNGKHTSKDALFLIDRRIPRVPVIKVNGDIYENAYVGETYKFYLNSAIASIECPPYCEPIIDVYYKRFNSQPFQLYLDSPHSIPEAFKKIGTYRIVVRSRKTTTGYKSTAYSEAIFKVKRKFTHTMKILPDGRNVDDDTLAYYDIAQINFADSLATDTDLDEEGFVEIQQCLNKMYRINNGSWRYYLDNIYIYDNCIIECMSVDEDGFQSYITTKTIRNIDKTPPPQPKIQVIDGGTARDIVDGECIINGATIVIDALVEEISK